MEAQGSHDEVVESEGGDKEGMKEQKESNISIKPGPHKEQGHEEPTMRQIIYALLDPSVQASSKRLAMGSTIVSISVFVLIYLSIVIFCIESHPAYYKKDNLALYSIECVCVAVFTIEFVLKVATVSDRKAFFQSFLNWIDLVSIMPFYLELFLTRLGRTAFSLNSFVFLRVIRLARVFRVFKLGKYSTGLQLVIYAMRQSSEALSLLGFLLGIALVLFASLVFIAEQSDAYFDKTDECWYYNWNDTNGQKIRSDFQSIPDSFWWALVTLATVGYGDQVPHTWFGKGVGITCMIVGVLVLAFPIILISNNFSDAVKEFNDQQRVLMEREEEEERAAKEAENPTATAVNTLAAPAGNVNVRSPSMHEMREMREYPKPSPSPYTVVAYFRYQGKMRPIYYVSSAGHGGNEVFQFRYDPLFTVQLDAQGIVDTTATVDTAINQYTLQFNITLDNEAAQQLAIDAINETMVFEKRKVLRSNTMATPLAKVYLAIPVLNQGQLRTTEVSSPGNSIGVVITANSKDELNAIQSRLPITYVSCTCCKGFGCTPDHEVTVPLLVSAATRSGVVSFEMHEAD